MKCKFQRQANLKANKAVKDLDKVIYELVHELIHYCRTEEQQLEVINQLWTIV